MVSLIPCLRHAQVTELNTRFALVLITEHYDESLIMLRRQLCWEPEDIVYMSLKVGLPFRRLLTWHLLCGIGFGEGAREGEGGLAGSAVSSVSRSFEEPCS